MAKKKKNQEFSGVMMEHSRLESNWVNYDHFWSTIKGQCGLKDEMKEALLKFLEKTGNNIPSKFENGLELFGIKR